MNDNFSFKGFVVAFVLIIFVGVGAFIMADIFEWNTRKLERLGFLFLIFYFANAYYNRMENSVLHYKHRYTCPGCGFTVSSNDQQMLANLVMSHGGKCTKKTV